jgi:cell division protein FtsA
MARFSGKLRPGDIIAAVEIGASKSACLIAAAVPGEAGLGFEILGVGLHGSAAEARVKGKTAARELALRGAIESAERMAGVTIRAASVAVSGQKLLSRRAGVDLELGGERVTREDVADCLSHAAQAASAEGHALLHALPIAFRLDGEAAGFAPDGLSGDLFTAEALGVLARDNALSNLDAMLERCGLAAEAFIAAPYAAAEAVLVEDEKDLGVVLLDIGAASTGYAVYEGGRLVDCGGVPVGGDHISRDIAQVFAAPIAQAERVKTLYGSAIAGPGDEHRMVELATLGDGESIRVPRADLSAVILPRVEEICELAGAKLPATARSRHGVRRTVLTGGASLLIGARETAERVLGMKARLGRPTAALAGAPEAATSPQFSVCAGTLILAHRHRTTGEGRVALVDQAAGPRRAGLAAAVGHWLKAHF